jgi:predicted RNA-binding Zn ribbon-like protein
MLRFRFGLGSPWVLFTVTVGARRATSPVERLREPGDLARWAREAGFGEDVEVSPAQLREAKQLRERIYRAADAVRSDQALGPSDVDGINTWAARRPLSPALGADGTLSWSGDGTIDEVLALIARDAVEALSSPLRDRIRLCADEECGALFVDLSHAGSRRWCSMATCGNRAKKRAFRARNSPSLS